MIRTRKGIRFELEETESTRSWHFWDLWADESWEPLVFPELDNLLPDGGCLIDVGAWVGPITLWAAQRARVVAIEPDPEALRLLRVNVSLNGLDDRVTIVGAAAAVEYGEVKLYSVREWGDSTSSMTMPMGHETTVPAVSLKAIIEAEKPDLVKMDVEGGEASLIPAVAPLLRSMGVPIILSIHPLQADITEAWEMLKAEWDLRDIDWGGGETFVCIPKVA